VDMNAATIRGSERCNMKTILRLIPVQSGIRAII
jgi:hypothetical protein